jgi:hypothetical protein
VAPLPFDCQDIIGDAAAPSRSRKFESHSDGWLAFCFVRSDLATGIYVTVVVMFVSRGLMGAFARKASEKSAHRPFGLNG